LSGGPHLKTFCRVVLPFIFNTVIGLTNLIDFFNVLLDGLFVAVDFDEEETSHMIGDVESHDFIHHIDRHFIQNLAGREGNARG
jgi:hypothetical protein